MKRMTLALVSAGAASLVLSVYFYVSYRGHLALFFDLVVLGLFLIFASLGVEDILKMRRTNAIESRLPDFLRDVAEASKFGTNLADSISIASSGQYGVLNKEIKGIAAQIEWGVSLDEALTKFAERNNTPFTTKLISTVIESNRSGGSVYEVMNLIADNSKETQLLSKEKYSQLKSYIIIVMMAYAVFLLTVIILDVQFFPKMAGQLLSGSSASPGTFLSLTSIPLIKEIFTGVVIIQGVGSGLMSGVLGDGRYQSGFLYAAILSSVGYLTIMLFGGV